MAGDTLHDPSKALSYKESGNVSFKKGDYTGAESWYTKAITHDKTNPLLYTNRAMALLKLSSWSAVIADAQASIDLQPHNMKAYYYLSQAQAALSDSLPALQNAKEAHRLCVSDGAKGQGSLQAITLLVLRCKKMDWERREKERLRGTKGLLQELEGLLEEMREKGGEEEKREWEKKVELLRSVFEAARVSGEEEQSRRRRKGPPDWCIDGISFNVMVDPLVTKTGKSYDRSSLMEHLKCHQNDPLTREPMTLADLRPNLPLKEACAEYLEENGWAADY